MKKYIRVVAISLLSLLAVISVKAETEIISSGRYFSPKFSQEHNDFTVFLTAGTMPKLDGKVVETKRASRNYYENRGEYEHFLATYPFDDLGFDEDYSLMGLELEKRWKYVSLSFGGSGFSASSSATARETYGINVESVDFGGREYENILIPEGQSFSTKLNGALLNLGFNITPFHINFDDSVHFTPWLHLGIFSMAGTFKINAGEAQGVTTDYEAEPIEYVVDGQAKGWFAAGFPEWGVGGEMVLEMATASGFDFNLIFDANFAMMNYSGSTSDFGISSRRAKDITLDYTNNEFGAFVEFPTLFKSADLLMGVQVRVLSADASVNAKKHGNEEEILLLQEKYDKDITLDITTVNGVIAIRF